MRRQLLGSLPSQNATSQAHREAFPLALALLVSPFFFFFISDEFCSTARSVYGAKTVIEERSS